MTSTELIARCEAGAMSKEEALRRLAAFAAYEGVEAVLIALTEEWGGELERWLLETYGHDLDADGEGALGQLDPDPLIHRSKVRALRRWIRMREQAALRPNFRLSREEMTYQTMAAWYVLEEYERGTYGLASAMSRAADLAAAGDVEWNLSALPLPWRKTLELDIFDWLDNDTATRDFLYLDTATSIVPIEPDWDERERVVATLRAWIARKKVSAAFRRESDEGASPRDLP